MDNVSGLAKAKIFKISMIDIKNKKFNFLKKIIPKIVFKNFRNNFGKQGDGIIHLDKYQDVF